MRSTAMESMDLPLESDDVLLPLPEILAPAPRGPSRGLKARERIAEQMDDPDLDEASHRSALRGLARLNWISGSVLHVWRPIHALAKRRGLKRLTLVDVATGGGDVPIALSRLARRAGIELRATGVDLSDQALDFARRQADERGEAVDFVRANVLADGLPDEYDVAICSLFLHHLAESEAVRVLRAMNAAATRLGLVNDLARSRLNLLQVWAASRVVSRSPVVRFDGPASVRAAFTRSEALELALRAGLSEAKVRRAFPCRYLMTWKPSR